MTKAEDRLMDWLRDAHAMEQHAIQRLSAFGDRIVSYPELKARIVRHIAESESQAQKLQDCIKRRGGDTSLFRDVAAKFTGYGQGLSGLLVGDEIIRGAMASYTFEHMEIATYRVLMAAAEEVGDEATLAACEENLLEEVDMAQWLAQHLSSTTTEYLKRVETGQAAKH